MDKRCRVVMLPTNEKAPLFFSKRDTRLHYWLKGNTPNNINSFQHLYITSDDDIREGDWWYNEDLNIISNQWNDEDNPNLTCEKIIATTDSSLNISQYAPQLWKYLPQPSQQFIEKYVEEYNKGNQIVDVLVEYDLDIDDNFVANAVKETAKQTYSYKDSWKPKVSKDNTITIRRIKDSWSRDEVESLLFKLAEHYAMTSSKGEIEDFNKWIEENI